MVDWCLIRKHGHLDKSITKHVLFVISKPIFNLKLKKNKRLGGILTLKPSREMEIDSLNNDQAKICG